MRIEGSITKWNDDRGFGFITPDQGGPEVFVHISAFPRDGQRPALGERISFEIETDGKGKKRATNLRCPNRSTLNMRHPSRPTHKAKSPSYFTRLVLLIAAVAIGAYSYNKYSLQALPETKNAPQAQELERPGITPTFSCDGRTYCSQMSSCAEAKFFQEHCPGTEMDGDHDGTPCEQQWCTNIFAR